jgi:hypothetical protein
MAEEVNGAVGNGKLNRLWPIERERVNTEDQCKDKGYSNA